MSVNRRDLLESFQDFFYENEDVHIGHLNSANVRTMTLSELMVNIRKCSAKDCNCELIDHQHLIKLLEVSHCFHDFLNRLKNVRDAFSLISKDDNGGHCKLPLVN